MGTYITASHYKTIIRNIPIVCIDLMLVMDGKYLLVKRANRPRRGEWWVPGGRILFGETIIQAINRKCFLETHLILTKPGFVGYYEEQYKTSIFHGQCHTISLVFSGVAVGNVETNDECLAHKWSKHLPADFRRGLRCK